MRRPRRTKAVRSRGLPRTSSSSRRRSPSRPLRLVSFRSHRVRFAWALFGVLLLIAAYFVAHPTFESNQTVPTPWRLWLSTDATTPNTNTHSSPGWLLRLNTAANDSCSQTIVTGALEWEPKEIAEPVSPIPTRYVIAIAGAQVSRLETRSVNPIDPLGTRRWHTTPLDAVSGAMVTEVRVAHWQGPNEPAEFRLTVAASTQPAGFESCYVTSPAIGDFYESGNADEAQPEAVFSVGRFLETRNVSSNLGEPLYLDTIAESEVPGQEPEDAAAPARLTLHPRAAVVTCTTFTSETHTQELDPYSEDLRTHTARPCAGVQLFRSSSLQATLTQHIFFSGLLASAAIAMLIEASMASVTDPKPAHAEKHPRYT